MFNGTITTSYEDLKNLYKSQNTKLYLHILIYYNNAFLKEVDITNKQIPLINIIYNAEHNIRKSIKR